MTWLGRQKNKNEIGKTKEKQMRI